MICYKDRTFCSSPDCKNECGRKITEDEKVYAKKLGLLVSYAYFCNKEPMEKKSADLQT